MPKYIIDPTARGALMDWFKDPYGASPYIEIEGANFGDGVMLDNVQLGEKDSVDPVDALGGKHVLYTFGSVFETVSVTGTVYLRTCSGGSLQSTLLSSVSGWFESARVSNGGGAVNVSAGDYKNKVYFYELVTGQADPARNTLRFTLNGIAKPRK